jgi:hypothetical protein
VGVGFEESVRSGILHRKYMPWIDQQSLGPLLSAMGQEESILATHD